MPVWELDIIPCDRPYTRFVLSSLAVKRVFACWLLALTTCGAAQQTTTSSAASRQKLLERLVAAAVERANHQVRYEAAYVAIPYPGGDVPPDTGVCTDEVIRSYRAVGIDLQKDVHDDMAANFSQYPRKWGRRRPDANIDHRRVPNLQVFFGRKGDALAITARAQDYAPGDLVTWDLGRGLTHIGIVVNRQAPSGNRYMILHNIGAGPKLEDVLFNWTITGHYRYFGPGATARTATSHGDAVEPSGIPTYINPDQRAYAPGMVFARFIRSRNIRIRSIHGSKMDGFFPETTAAFFRTDEGAFEVISFPEPNGAESVEVEEQCCVGGLIAYTLRPEPPRKARGIQAAKPHYFVKKRNWLMVTTNQTLSRELERAVRDVSANAPTGHD